MKRIGIFPLAAMIAAMTVQAVAQTPETLARQREEYDAVRAKGIVELQPFRRETDAFDPASGLFVRFTALNPAVDAWFLLETRTAADGKAETWHIENPDPAAQAVAFDPGAAPALILRRGAAQSRCAPWGDALIAARNSGLAYAPICDGALFLRNPVSGARTNLEATAEFLRDNLWGGEGIVRFVRDTFFKDAELETGETLAIGGGGIDTGPAPMIGRSPPEARPVISTLLDIAVDGTDPGRMAVGLWYPVTGLPGVYASAFQPREIGEAVLNGPGKTNRLDSIEAGATGYMVAFDTGRFDIGFAMGTDHPALGWSPRPPASVRPRGLPGPDGVKSASPLVMLGMVNPVIANRAVATFTAGFKREHGAFKFGDMAGFNLGHHYGFIEKGVILSKLQPGLSTLFGLTDGSLHMKTWTEADNALLPRVAFARQNGVPLIETDPATGLGVPGDRVTQWGAGNWSGSAKAELRTLRAGACMATAHGTSHLIYGYFSTATPSAMARTFQAYGCSYAMLLDMNALEHTYLALYVPRGGRVHVAHMVPGMALIEKKLRDGTILPRFIGFADNRDLFYVTRKEAEKMRPILIGLVLAMAVAMPASAQTALQQANAVLFQQLKSVHRLSDAQLERVKQIFARSGFIGQGNPAITRHPMTPEQCAARIPGGPQSYNSSRNERICGGKYMAPLYDPRTERPEDARACIDQFEFPDIPCSYPVVWTKAMEAAEICAAVGKRLCDAHEWEGACAGALEPPDYFFGLGSVAAMRNAHNAKYAASKSWAYGPAFRRGVCAQNSEKSGSCGGGGYNSCGSNTYPTGAFPECRSALGVYDQHGNAAEHMNLPMAPDQMASRGSTKLGVTEMKGSWFIWDKYQAHPDWCRWRAPYWHGTRVMTRASHENYHLGFRCCKTVE